MTHYKFPKIVQYHQVIKGLQLRHSYDGKDENGDPIYDKNKELPTITFEGHVKLHGCVSSDTEVLLSDGSTKPISDLEIGTSIISYNTISGEMENDIVTNVLSDNLEKDWVELEFDNGYKIKCTEDHPIYTKNRGYIKAIELKSSDIFISSLE